MNDTLKDRIGNYELLEILGDGAQGKVFKARCVDAAGGPVARDEVVAIKVLRVPPDDEQAHQRFQTQADILKRLAHPNIIRYRDSFIWHPGEWDEAQCLVMEYLDGETLAARLRSARHGLPWPEVKNIFEQCFAGLIDAGRQGIVHRDLKPSNIFLTRDGSVRIFDFDIARVEGDSARSTQGWKGSFDYMAPDFVSEPDFHGDEISDVFSLGTCICQALTGRLPFEPFGENAHIGYLNRWRNAAAPLALSFRAGAYRVLANAKSFISRSLDPRRAKRYQSFAEMLADFQRIRRRVIQHLDKDAYELRAMLGRGGFGEVFEGVRLSDGRPVAIKHLFAERQSSRFVKEAKILQRYAHPHVVKYEDFIEVRGATQQSQYFLILELLAGMPEACLRYRIKQEGKLEPVEAIPVFLNYLDALSFLHNNPRPLIHRDIKPMNLYAPAGHPENAKVFDLGVARDVSGTVTTGGIPGTLDYMAPEFAQPGAGRGTPQSDLYSLGLCLYEALTGQSVFPRLPLDINSSWPIFQARARDRPAIDYRARVFGMYPDLMAVVEKSIALQPGDRYADAAAMRRDLEKIMLRLDRPEEVAVIEASTTVAAASVMGATLVAPMPGTKSSDKVRQPSAPEPAQPAAEHLEPALPDLPDIDMAAEASAARARRRKRALRAAAAILVLLAAGAGATVWWSGAGRGARPAIPAAATVPQPPPDLQSPIVPPPEPAAESAAAAPAESDELRAARAELDQVVRSVRIPIADAAYVENLVAALARVRRLGGQYPELADEAGRKAGELEQRGRDLPALFQSGLDMAIAQRDTPKAASLLAAWRTTRPYAPLMGLTAEQARAQETAMANILGRYQLETGLAGIAAIIPSRFAGDRELEQAQQATEALDALECRTWPGVPEEMKKTKIVALRAKLISAMRAGIKAWRDEALAAYRQGQEDESGYAALLSIQDSAPAALELVHADYQDALKAVAAAREDWAVKFRKQLAVLKAIEQGSNALDREALAGLPVDPERVLETAAAAGRVRKGFNTLALLDAAEPSRVFLAMVADCWKKAELCTGPLADAIQNAAWTAIHDQMVAQGTILLQPREMMQAGVRTPEQQARVRREYLRLLAQVETVTGRVSGCPAGDPLRAQVERYFQRPFFHRALLEDPSFAANIPWLAEEFRKAQIPGK